MPTDSTEYGGESVDTEWAYIFTAILALAASFWAGERHYRSPQWQGRAGHLVTVLFMVAMGAGFALMLFGAYTSAIGRGAANQILLICVMCVLTPLALALWRRTRLWPWWLYAVSPVVVALLLVLTMIVQAVHYGPMLNYK